ncbi:MAG: mannitol dehydrogenase [Clostridiales bacterium]|nr:mannitol dehydrogenase [Clostridiales bacterium]
MIDNRKKALMYGAGSIGRGFLGQLFHLSGYETCFIDVDEILIQNLNENGQYVITVATESGYESQTIKNTRAVNGMDTEKVAHEIACCNIMATAVGVNILPKIAKTIAEGIDMRFTKGTGESLDIIVCENISDGSNHLKKLVSQYINNKKYFEENIGFVSASVGRMVPVNSDSNSSDIIVESYNELPLDADSLKTDVSSIKNFMPVTPFAIEKDKKYFMHNMSHAIVAYMGFINGYEFIWEAIGDKSIRIIAEKALEESITAIIKYYNADETQLRAYALNLLKRYSNKYLKDTVIRVGRDPKRKLQPEDRLTGAALFCLSQGIVPKYILYGIAAAFCFDVSEDVSSPEVTTYVKEYGIKSAITEYTGITDQSPLYSKILKVFLQLKIP